MASSPAKNIRKGISFTVSKDLAGRLSFLRNFPHKLTNFNTDIEAILLTFCQEQEKKVGVLPTAWLNARPCPACENGTLLPRAKRNERKPAFMGCSKFPVCRHTEPLSTNKE